MLRNIGRCLVILALSGLALFSDASPLWAGYGSIGDQTAEATNGETYGIIRGGIYTMPHSGGGVADTLWAYMDLACDVCLSTDSLKMALYLWHTGSSAVLVDTTAQQVIAANTNAAAWYSGALLNAKTVYADSEYLIVVWAHGGLLDVASKLRYLTPSTGDTMAFKTVTFGAWPSPLASASTSTTHRCSVYLVYHSNLETAPTADGDTGTCSFGNATLQASTSTIEGIIWGGRFTAPVTAPCKSIMIYCDNFAGAPSPGHVVKCALYKFSDSTLITNGSTDSVYVVSGDVDAWRVFKFNTQPTVTGGADYYVCAWTNNIAGNMSIRLKTTTGQGAMSSTVTYGSWPTPKFGTATINSTYLLSARVFYVCPGSRGRRRKIIERLIGDG